MGTEAVLGRVGGRRRGRGGLRLVETFFHHVPAFCRMLSGRATGEGMLTQQVPF